MRKLLTTNLIIVVFIVNLTFSSFAENNSGNTKTVEPQINAHSNLSLLSDNFNNKSFSLAGDKQDVRLAIINIQIDPLGILFFGPQVSLDLQIANFIAIGPDFTWHYAGLLYQMFMTDFFSDGTTLGLETYGIGGHMKFLIPTGSGRNRPYVGFGYEKFFGEETYDDSDLGMKYANYKSNVLHVDLGFKHLTEGSFNFSIGLTLAVSKVAESSYYYESNTDDINYYEPGETMVFPILQMVLGWQIGSH